MKRAHPLRELRQRVGVSAEVAASRIRWSPDALRRVERGYGLEDKELEAAHAMRAGDALTARMAEALGLSVAEARAICTGDISPAHDKILRDAFRGEAPGACVPAAGTGKERKA